MTESASSTYNVRAVRWAHGWELHIDGVGVTQSRGLKDAEDMVRDYLRLEFDAATARQAEIVIAPAVGELDPEAADVRRRAAEVRAAD